MAPDKMHKIIFNRLYLRYTSQNDVFDHLLESPRWEDSYKLWNIGFFEEVDIIEINLLILSGVLGSFISLNE